MIACLLASIIASACSPTVQTIEVTRVVPQTVVVTQLTTKIITVNITTTPITTNTPVPDTPTLYPTDTPEPTHVIDMSSQDGRIVVIQYYTLLGLHLFDQAYQLLSSDLRTNYNYTEKKFLDDSTNFYKIVKVLKVIPAKEEDKANLQCVCDNWYYAEIYAEGENGMSGPFVNGIQQGYFQVTRENGEWKIEKWGDGVDNPSPTPG